MTLKRLNKSFKIKIEIKTKFKELNFVTILKMPTLSKKRHIAKTFTWRLIASLDTLFLGWLITGNIKLGASLMSLEIVTKTFLYYFHERVWYKSKFGINGSRNKVKN